MIPRELCYLIEKVCAYFGDNHSYLCLSGVYGHIWTSGSTSVNVSCKDQHCRRRVCHWETCLGNRKEGGQNVSCDLGGGECSNRAPPPKPVLVGFVWSVPVPSKEHDRACTGGGKTYHRWGGRGSKTIFGEGHEVRQPKTAQDCSGRFPDIFHAN